MMPLRWLVAAGTGANCPSVLACARACLGDAPYARDALRSSRVRRWHKRSHLECRPRGPAVHGTFGVCCAWAVREKRCGSVGVDRFAATEAASIAAMRVGVEVGVLGERVRVVVDRVGVPGGHGGRVGGCGDGCGSGGTILRPTEVFTKSFVFGLKGPFSVNVRLHAPASTTPSYGIRIASP